MQCRKAKGKNFMKLTVSNLSFSYENTPILNDVHFQIGEGEFVSILGPSGCGKSTILNLLAGLLPLEQDVIEVDNSPIHGVSGHFAYMPQNDLLFPWKTILDNVCLYGSIHGQKKEARSEALKNFAAFGLEGYEYAYPSSLSGGMRQRAAFLRTALCEADILLLDEPFGALDVISRGDMQDWLLSVRERLNRTVLLVTHDMDEAIYLSDRILILGQKPSHIVREISIAEKNRTRQWLYEQSELRKTIYQTIMGGSR